MKMLLAAALAAVSVCLLSACNTAPLTASQALAKTQTALTVICPVLTDEFALFQSQDRPAVAAKAFADAAPIVKSTCTAIVTVNTTTAAQFVNTVLPAALVILDSAPNVTQAKKDEITGAVAVAQAALLLIINALPTTGVPAPASGVIVALR